MTLFEQIKAIFGDSDPSHDLEFALTVLRDRSPDDEFAAMVRRVEGKFEASRNYSVVLQFIQDQSKLRDREVIRLFEFIYSSMVNKFKGELGEVLARPALRAFQRTLPPDTTLILGPDIASRQLRRRYGWYPAADALYCHERDGGIEILAIGEVKSKATPFPEIRQQVETNLIRLRRGVRIRNEEIAPEKIFVRTVSGGTIPIASITVASARDVVTLMVLPYRAAVDDLAVRHPEDDRVWIAELPWKQDVITEAAYRLMSWYFSRIGPKVFYHRADPPPSPDGRRPAAHPDLSLEENGRHAFMEAIYHTTGRAGFDPREIPERGHRTPWQTLLWLYNSLGFGYSEATTDEFMYPEFEPTDEAKSRVERHDAAVAAFREGRFDDALAQLPDPAEQSDRWWARREWLMLARIHARRGDSSAAREAVARVKAMPPIESLSLPIEIAGVEALIALAEGDDAAIGNALRAGLAAVETVREQVRQHEENGWELPSDIEPNSAREGVIDIAAAHAATGDCETALSLLRRLRKLRGWELNYFGHDALLARCMTNDLLHELYDVSSRRDDFAIF
ncbi:MAG TPA: hypothetical protein VFN10_04810 [Thermoanaerobaculia bacterium]|nr:hypothetical protein [Thermoanaerobaculia bacterium]